MDLIGPITPAGKNGEKYILSILDEKSKLGVVKHARPWSRKDASPIWEPLMFTVPFEE